MLLIFEPIYCNAEVQETFALDPCNQVPSQYQFLALHGVQENETFAQCHIHCLTEVAVEPPYLDELLSIFVMGVCII